MNETDDVERAVGMKIFIIFVAIFAVSGCGPVVGPRESPAEVIRAHIEAMNREDLEAAMSYIDSDGPNYAITRSTTEQLFKVYDIRYSVEVLGQVTSEKKGEVRMKVIQTTQKIAGPAFADNKITMYYVLKEGWFSWKIVSTEVLSGEYLKPNTP
ncbi:MAG: hypothetical protein HOP17_11975 [Acidobacteria bacterium]|nr:hypothetical protein [Acidobacteriota bacterium]